MRLIDAEELEKANCGRCKESKDGKWSIDCLWISCQWGDVMPVIQKLPTVDAVPVKRGRWIQQYDGSWLVKCSHCGYEYSDYIECDNFCGNCGADMRGDKDEAD